MLQSIVCYNSGVANSNKSKFVAELIDIKKSDEMIVCLFQKGGVL